MKSPAPWIMHPNGGAFFMRRYFHPQSGPHETLRGAAVRLLLVGLILLAPIASRADTIYQTDARGRTVVMHREAILVKQDASSIEYKHFELKERRVVKIRISRGAQNYTVTTTSPEDRRQIVAKWRRFAYTATLTDTAGNTTKLAGLYLDFYPPAGRGSLLESVPARTSFPVLIEAGSADEIDFSKISRLEFQGERITMTLTDGQVKQAKFLMPTDQPAEARFLGITDKYDPASPDVFDFAIPLEKVKDLRFE
jgi:hypothetical protein